MNASRRERRSPHPVLVIVSGPPGAGKTTIARRLASELPLPLVAKDDIKETLFESLGWSDREWSKKLGSATWDLLFVLLERFATGRTPLILESNFYPELHRQPLSDACARHGYSVIEIHCTAEPAIMSDRFRKRDRHPGHDPQGTESFTAGDAAAWLDQHAPIALGAVIEVDTTDPDRIDWGEIVTRVRRELGERDGSQDR